MALRDHVSSWKWPCRPLPYYIGTFCSPHIAHYYIGCFTSHVGYRGSALPMPKEKFLHIVKTEGSRTGSKDVLGEGY